MYVDLVNLFFLENGLCFPVLLSPCFSRRIWTVGLVGVCG